MKVADSPARSLGGAPSAATSTQSGGAAATRAAEPTATPRAAPLSDRFVAPRAGSPAHLPPIHREPDGWNPLRVWTAKDGDGERVYVQGHRGPVCLGHLETIPAGTPLYHWSNVRALERWDGRGVSPEEMEGRIAQNVFSMGGGLYVSLGAYDSTEFGSHLAIFDPPRDLRVAVYQHVMGSIEDALGVNRVTLNYALRDAGLAGTRSVAPGANTGGLRSTWINVLVPDPLTTMRPGTFDDIAPSMGIAQSLPRTELVSRLLDVDATKAFALSRSATLQRVAPSLVRLMRGQALTRGQHDTLWPTLRGALCERGKGATFAPEKLILRRAGQELLPAIRREFAAEIQAELTALAPDVGAQQPLSLASAVAQDDPAGVSRYTYQKRFGFLGTLARAGLSTRAVGLDAEVQARPFSAAVHPEAALHGKDTFELKNDFGRRLHAAFALGDASQVADAIARGATPWEVPSLAGVHVERFDAIARSGMTGSVEGLRAVHAALTRADVDPTALGYGRGPSSPLRATRHHEERGRLGDDERRALESNPFLAVEVRPDPELPGTWHARWEHPSAFTWRRFEHLLPAPLVARLKAAEPLREDAPEAGRLTADVVSSLLERALKASHFRDVPSLQYQLLEAVHPFETATEPAIRAFVAKTTRDGMVIDRETALLRSPDQLAIDLAAARTKHAWLGLGFARAEREDAAMPRFYDCPELAAVVNDTPGPAAA